MKFRYGTFALLCAVSRCLVVGWGFQLSLDFFPRGLHTRTAVMCNPCIGWAFLLSYVVGLYQCYYLQMHLSKIPGI